jgi:glycosyltransferase involved in cell wall biosynthesis
LERIVLASYLLDVFVKNASLRFPVANILLIRKARGASAVPLLNLSKESIEKKMSSSSFAYGVSAEHAPYPFVSIIMPAFNEEKAIGNVVSELFSVMKISGLSFEIIAVDDGSTDKTCSEALRCGAVVLSNGENHGKGYCLRKGLEKARGEVVVTMDSDGEHRPTDVLKLLGMFFKGNDVVAGSRFLNGGANFTSRIHYFGNQLMNLAVVSMVRKRITDSQTGFRAIKHSVFEKLRLESDGFEVETEITVKVLKNGFAFAEVPISVMPRKFGVSRVKLLWDGTKIFKTIVKASLAEVEH